MEPFQYDDGPLQSWLGWFIVITFSKLQRFERTEIAIAKVADKGKPIALQGFGHLYFSICSCPTRKKGRQWNTFPGSCDFSW